MSPTTNATEISLLSKLRQMDLVGTALVLSSTICFTVALQWGGTRRAWNDLCVLALLFAAFVLLQVFFLVEWRMGDRAFFQGRFLRCRAICVNCLYTFL